MNSSIDNEELPNIDDLIANQSSNETQTGSEEAKKIKRRGPAQKFTLMQTFYDKYDLGIYMNCHYRNYAYSYTNHTRFGKKVYYRCKLTKYKSNPHCGKTVMVFYLKNKTIQIHENDMPHEYHNKVKIESESAEKISPFDPVSYAQIEQCLIDDVKVEKDVKNWLENDVDQWINEKNFDANIINVIFPCNGEHLVRMYEMYQKIPEFFYNSLNFSKNVYLKDLVHFSNELIKLFE